jgi:hypothetical protein
LGIGLSITESQQGQVKQKVVRKEEEPKRIRSAGSSNVYRNEKPPDFEKLFDDLWRKLITREELACIIDKECAKGNLTPQESSNLLVAVYTSMR